MNFAYSFSMKAKSTVVLLVVLVSLFGCTGQPNLELEETSSEDNFWFDQGCYTTVSGYVKNFGSETAESVKVSCSTIQEESVFDSKTQSFNSLLADSREDFSLDIDTDCLKGEVTFECTVSCDNCGETQESFFDSGTVQLFGILLVIAVAAVIIILLKKKK